MALISQYVDQDEIRPGVFQNTIALKPVGYRRLGSLLRAVPDFADSGDGTMPHAVQRAPLRVLATSDGMRRMFPLPDDDTKYLEIGAPWIQIAGTWTQVALGTPTRSANTITWTRPQTITTLTHAGYYVKIEIELLGGFVPQNSRIAFPVALGGGLTRSGTAILDGSNVVANLRPFVMYDAANPLDIRPITHQFTTLNSQPYLLLTLPSLTGMSRPVIDPTLSLQPDATAGIDNFIELDFATSNFGTSVNLYIGETNNAVGRTMRTLIKFDVSSIPANAIITSAIQSLYVNSDFSSNARTARWYRLKRAWVEDQSTWNIYSTGNNWDTAGGFGANDCEQTDIGSLAFSASETLSVFKDWSLTPSAVQGWISGAFANNGTLGMMDTELNDGYQFASSDSATAAQRPKLVVVYTTGGIIYPRRMDGLGAFYRGMDN